MRKQVMIEQRTPEWFAWKKGRIGASDAPALLGVSPWKTKLGLYEEKVKEKALFINDAMRAGTEYEALALEAACEELKVDYKPACFDHPYREYMCASLDGWNENQGVLELKLANKDDHELAKAGIVPEKYVPQLQAQMANAVTTNAVYGSYVVKNDEIWDIAFVMVRKDIEVVERIEQEAEEFYERIISFNEPEPTERDFVAFKNPELEKMFLDASQMLEFWENMKETARQKIIRFTGERNATLGCLKVTKSYPRGRVDYKAIPELKGVNLDLYRGPKELRFTITAGKH